jgi:hypothetical protein
MAAFASRTEIRLTSMRQLAEVCHHEFCPMSGISLTRRKAVDKEDDWTGLTDAAARRKRQNRLNVRAYRK